MITGGQSNLTKGHIAATHGWCSGIQQVAPVCTLLLLFRHAPLRVFSAIRRHQPPQRAVLSQIDCFVQCEVVGSQVSLDGAGTPWSSLPVLWREAWWTVNKNWLIKRLCL